MGGVEEVQGSGISCREVIIALGAVCTGLAGVIVAMAKIGWNHILEDNKIARDRGAVLDVAVTSALKKKGESPT